MGIPAVGDVTAAPLNYMINCLMDERLSVLCLNHLICWLKLNELRDQRDTQCGVQ